MNPDIIGYSDADYANDVETRRSTTGYCIMYCGGPIAWKCQRQSIVSLSTAEAEYISGCELVKELLPISSMMIELKLRKPIPAKVLVDNQSAVNIAKHGGQQRTKHIDVREKWLTEQQARKNISVEYIQGSQQKADILTKPLHKNKFNINKTMLITIMTMFLMLHLVIGSVSTYKFQQTEPVVYVPINTRYITSMREYDLTFKFIKPCEPYFEKMGVLSNMAAVL